MRVDKRTIRGRWIREQIRESILTAYIALIRKGVAAPTARETAALAEVSLRVIFNHFADLRALRLAAFARMQAESSALLAEDIPGHGSAAQRLARFVAKHTRRLEHVTPLHRTAAMVESIDPQVADAMRKARNTAARDLEKALGPTLDPLSARARRELLIKLHTACSWSTWEMLRTHYRLSPARARSIMAASALAILTAELETSVEGANGCEMPGERAGGNSEAKG